MWIPPEDRDPIVRHAPTRKGVGYYGAVRLRDGRFVWRREAGKFNGETYWAFLRYLRQITAPSPGRTVVIEDNASYHHAALHRAWREACETRFAIHFLPSYAPELNPIERVWKLTRKLRTHNRYFASLDEVITTVEAQFGEWRRGSEDLRRLCAIN
jgi:transposase